MLKPLNMIKVGVVCPHNLLDSVIDKLYKLKVIEIEEHSKDNDFDLGVPLEKGEELSELTIKLKSIASHINLDLNLQDYTLKSYDYSFIKERINEYFNKIKILMDNIEFYNKVVPILKNEHYKKVLKSIVIDNKRAKDSEYKFFCGIIDNDITQQVKELSQTSEVIIKDVDGLKLIFVFVPNSLIFFL